MLSAAYLAGLREIDPSPIGGQVHALMMVASAAVVAGALPRADRALPVLFHLQRIKRSVARDARGEDWTMPAAPAVEPAPRAEHVRVFRAAMGSWDEPAGDRAAVALHRELSLREFFEELWPWAARDFRIIGHKMIFATQTFRAVEDLGWRLARDAVRAVVRGVLDQNPYDAFAADDSKAIFAAHEANLERLGRLPANWRAGRDDPEASFELLAKLRESTLENAGDLVIAAATRGVGERSIWDGLRLAAFELSLRHPDIAGMHPVTSVNALYRGSRITDREATRRLCVLQAADWMVLFRDFLAPRGPRDLRLDALRSAQQKGAPADPFGAGSESEAWSLAYDFAADPVAFGRRAYDVLAVKAQHDHDYKFTVAAVEELSAAHPRCRPALAAASMADLRRVGDPDNDAIELLRRRRLR
ncbi:MAG: hypothetical protein NXI31_10920 [bacterium]|nr:hypothetical protein [bacterium]